MRWRLLLLLTVCLTLLSACSRGQPQQKPVPPHLIGVSVATEDKELAELLRRNMQSGEKEGNVRLVWQAAPDASQQEKQIKKLLERRIDVLVAWFADPRLGARLAPEISGKGVRLVLMQELAPDTPADALVMPDPERVGALAGEFIRRERQAGRAKGSVLLVASRDDPGAAAMARGLAGALGGEPVLVEVERREPHPEDVLQDKLGGPPGAVVAQDGKLTEAVVKVLDGRGLAGQVVTVGVGGGKQAARLLGQQLHDAEVDTSPEMVARTAFQAARELATTGSWQYETRVQTDGYDVPARLTPARLVTFANAYLLEARWGKLPRPGQGEPSPTGGSAGGGAGGSGGSGGGEGGGGAGSRVIVKTKDGKQLEMNVEGEIESIQVEKAKPGGKAEGSQGGKQAGQ